MTHSRGLLIPLRDRVRALEREVEMVKRSAATRVHELETECERLRMAVKAMSSEVKPGADEPGAERHHGTREPESRPAEDISGAAAVHSTRGCAAGSADEPAEPG